VTQAVLADRQTAPIDERLRATLGFLRKVTLTPDQVGPEDVNRVRAVGVRDEAIGTAIYVCAIFNLIDRVADALKFHVPDRVLPLG
jgi:alkylhydroperoxidase family enzyme